MRDNSGKTSVKIVVRELPLAPISAQFSRHYSFSSDKQPSQKNPAGLAANGVKFQGGSELLPGRLVTHDHIVALDGD